MNKKLRRFEQLKEQLENAQREQSKAEGVLEQLKKELNEEFDCPTIKEAKQLLETLEDELADEEEKSDEELNDFEREYGKLIKLLGENK